MSQMMHWSEPYLGQPWVLGQHDCWQFFRRVQRERFGLDLPVADVDFDAGSTISCARALAAGRGEQWLEVAQPAEGDAVLLGRSTVPTHVGIWVAVDGGAVLHCVRVAGVVRQDLDSLSRHGWGWVRFYRWQS